VNKPENLVIDFFISLANSNYKRIEFLPIKKKFMWVYLCIKFKLLQKQKFTLKITIYYQIILDFY